MPKDLKMSIDFFQAYHQLLKKPVRDTVGSQQDTIPQDTLPRDTISPDTLSTEELSLPDTATTQPAIDSLEQEQAVTPAADTTSQTSQPSQAVQPAQAQPAVSRQQPPARQRETTKEDPVATLHDILGVTELPIEARLKSDPAYHNFLYNIPSVKPQDSLEIQEIYQPTDQTPRQLREEKQVQPGNEIPAQNPMATGYDWITFILVGSLILVGWTRLFYKKYFISLIKSFHFYNYASTLYFGKNSITQRAGVFLNLNFFIITGLLAFQVIQNFSLSISEIRPVYLWLGFTAFFMVWYAWNFLMSRFIGFVFLRQRAFSEYLHNYNLYRKIAGMAIFPIVTIVQFIQEEYREAFLIAGGILLGIIFLVHIIRGLQVFLKEGVSIFYLFLYLCALEFLPILLVFEVFIRQLSS